jgi:predicted phosphate transport protein (TIGR00153 family)
VGGLAPLSVVRSWTMPMRKLLPFVRTKAIEDQINEFLDTVSEAGMVFEMGVGAYLDNCVDKGCEERLEQISELESRGDELRRSIETALYTEMLIPDFRGDVLSLLEDLDSLLDALKSTLLGITIERPDVPEETKKEFTELISVVVKSVESTVLASRAFFTDINSVRDHIHKIGFYEREADKVAIGMKKNIFNSSLPLDRKMHIRDLVDAIDVLADEAENVGDRLSIYTIKRTP